ncbi:MAG: tetratricopeptide repeat protein, partial [Candidatus Aenigmatarchaeota archaeon]
MRDGEKGVLNIIILSTVLVSIIGLYQVLFGFINVVKRAEEAGLSEDIVILARSQTRAFSTFIHPNTMAGYLCLIIPLCMYIIIEEISMIRNAIYAAALSILITSLLFTYSRGGWITSTAGFIAFMFFLFYERISLKKAIPIFLGIIVGFILFFSFRYYSIDIINRDLPSIQERISKLELKGISIQGRLVLWKGALNIIKHNPIFGTGIGTFMHAYPHYQEKVFYSRYAHNTYLQMWSETGIIGLAAFFIPVILCLKTKPVMEKLNLYKFAMISLFLFLLHNAIDFDWESPAIMATFFIILSMITYTGEVNIQNDTSLIRLSEGRLVRRYIISSLLTIALCLIILLPCLSDGYFVMARSLFEQGKYEDAIHAIRKARGLFPIRGEHYYGEAEIYKKMGDVYKKREYYDEALSYVKRAIHLEPLNPYFRRELGIIYWILKDYEKAIEEFRRAVEITPGNVFLHNTLGKAYMYLGRLDDAKRQLRRALELENDYFEYSHPDIKDIFETHFILAEIAVRERNLNDAIRELEGNLTLLKRGPNFYHVGRRERNAIYDADTVKFAVCYNLGKVMEMKGDLKKALTYYLKAQS